MIDYQSFTTPFSKVRLLTLNGTPFDLQKYSFWKSTGLLLTAKGSPVASQKYIRFLSCNSLGGPQREPLVITLIGVHTYFVRAEDHVIRFKPIL